MDAHQLIAALKEVALELNRTPTRAEFSTRVAGSDYAIRHHFRSFSLLLKAAGMETYDDRRSANKRRIDNSVFTASIENHLENYAPKVLEPSKPGDYQRTLFIGDVHAPFANLKVLEKVYRFAEKHDPQVIVQVGDLYDLFSHTKFPRSHNAFTPRQEQETARKQAEEMWMELKKAAPGAECYQLYGNHDVRPLKRILESYPQAEDWIKTMLGKMMTFEGVTTLDDARAELMLPGNVMVHHGYLGQLGRHRDYSLNNAVVGHSHVGGVVYKQLRGEILWELNCGYVGDQNAKGLSYTMQRTVAWTTGWGWLDEYGPRFIPA